MSFIDFSDRNIGLKGKHMFVNRLESHGELGVLIGHLNRHFHNPQTKQISIHFKKGGPLYSNLVAPLSSILNQLQALGKKVVIHSEDPSVEKMCLVSTPTASSPNMDESQRILDKVWCISNYYHLDNIVSFMRRYLGSKLSFTNPALNVIEIALIEAIENALIHAGTDGCYVMAQTHERQGYFSVCVSDTGIGVVESLRSAGLRYDNDLAALHSSLHRGITSKHNENRGGNGLYALSRMARINRGHFGLWSGTSSVVVDGKSDEIREYQYLPDFELVGESTHVHFQIPLVGDISDDYHEVTDDMIAIPVEDSPPQGFRVLEIAKMPDGYHSRHAGGVSRDITKKILSESAVEGVVLDFSGVPICSLSFLDGFLGILSKEIGIDAFREKVRIRSATHETERAVASVIKTR